MERGKRRNKTLMVLTLATLVFGCADFWYGCRRVSVTPELISKTLPVKGMVTMIDLGAKKCIPCKMMAPILEKMEKRYEGRAAIVFIDVWEHREQASRFGIRAIPTQIFYDARRQREASRHVGFMSEDDIVKTSGPTWASSRNLTGC
jgi:thioredoxin 1